MSVASRINMYLVIYFILSRKQVAIMRLMNSNTIQLSSPEESLLGGFLINVPTSQVLVPEHIEEFAIAAGFIRKNEYHITLIGVDAAHLIDDLEAKDEMMDILYDLEDWNMTPTSKYLFLAKPDIEEGVVKESIIQIVDVPALNEFYEKLAATRVLELPLPPAHITLFTKNGDQGIGVYSQEDLDDYYIRQL